MVFQSIQFKIQVISGAENTMSNATSSATEEEIRSVNPPQRHLIGKRKKVLDHELHWRNQDMVGGLMKLSGNSASVRTNAKAKTTIFSHGPSELKIKCNHLFFKARKGHRIQIRA